MGHTRARVLVVDDDEDVRVMLEDLLARKGFDVAVACDGGEAIEMLERGEQFDVILADLVMPGIIGNELIEYLCSVELSDLPVAIVTGSPNLAPAGYPVFRKPVHLRDLVEFVRSSCHVRRGQGDCDRSAPISVP